MSEHARLSPSASERWLSCPASVRVVEAMPRSERDSESVYAHEGTVAHELGEIEASREFGLIDDKTYLKRHRAWKKEALLSGLSREQLDDMAHYIEGYVELIGERLEATAHGQLLLEQRMPSGVPSSWGTSDVVIVGTDHIEIIDLKYGQGVAVSSTGNPQLRLYALGALDTFGDVLGDTKTVRVTIYQPRINNTSWEEMEASELRAWREMVLPIAASALDGTGGFGPSEEACRWCPASGQCRAQLDWVSARDFSEDPDLLSPAELANVLEMLPAVKQWASAVEEVALNKAYSEGVALPGWKVVISGGNRIITNQELALSALSELGLPEDQLVTPPKIKGLGDLEKALKQLPKLKPEGASRARFQTLEDVLPEDALGRSPGRPSLVGEHDPRPAVNPNTEAQKEFDS